jgi:hypothetical protein
MMSVFEGFLGSIVPLEFLVQHPDGIVDVRLYHRDIPFMPPDWTDITMFDQQGIVQALPVPYPHAHFFIQGYAEAIQSCVTTFMVHQIDCKMDQFTTQQRIVARRTTLSFPVL